MVPMQEPPLAGAWLAVNISITKRCT
jgi:hypothetical protein